MSSTVVESSVVTGEHTAEHFFPRGNRAVVEQAPQAPLQNLLAFVGGSGGELVEAVLEEAEPPEAAFALDDEAEACGVEADLSRHPAGSQVLCGQLSEFGVSHLMVATLTTSCQGPYPVCLPCVRPITASRPHRHAPHRRRIVLHYLGT